MKDIAIVGLGCRFPGGITSLETFAKVLFDGIDAISEIPEDRWCIEKFYAPLHVPGKARTKWGGFINDPYHFDAQYFDLTPREVESMDPQQRILLEIFCEALQDANIPEEKIKGSKTGVYIGAFTIDHMINEISQSNWDAINSHTSTGSMMTLLSNRISYLYDLTGPSLTLDTACSSSLVAIHLAVEAIKNGECTQAIAGGVNLMLNPGVYVAESKANMLSPTGRSRSFDKEADGYVRGEGAGILILKSLEDAIEEKDYIYAVIKASAVNQDGRSSGQTVPNGTAQQELINIACSRAQISPADLQYVEAHGTGTPVGDPIEANAIGAAVSVNRSKENPCYIGSVKTNFGHTEAAAGVASLIKAMACLKYEKLSKLVHFKEANPTINFDALKLKPVIENTPWPKGNKSRLLGVNCFGFGGTNAHVIIGDSPAKYSTDIAQTDVRNLTEVFYLPISAKGHSALLQSVSNMLNLIESKQYSIKSICSSAALFRTHYNKRALFIGKTQDDLVEKMRLFLESQLADEAVKNQFNRQKTGMVKSAMVLSGMGPQWWGMGRELLEKEPVFRKTFNHCCDLFDLLTSEFSIREEFISAKDNSRLTEPQLAQISNFILQVALSDLYKSKGISFDCIVGHSVGEISAAYIAGALSLEDAVLVTFHRSRLQQTMSGSGKMLAVGMSFGAANELIAGYRDTVSIAAINAPESVTLAGSTLELEILAEQLERKGIFNKLLRVDVPYHSPILEPLKVEFLQSVAQIKPRKNDIQLFSTVTGEEISGQNLGPEYWWRNLRCPVYFLNAIENIINEGINFFCELGPHPVLSNSINQILESKKQTANVVYSLKRDVDQFEVFLNSMRQLYILGYPIDWIKIYSQGDKAISLPKYPWQRTEYRNDVLASKAWRFGNSSHELLGYRVFSPIPTWELKVNQHEFAYLYDHKVHGQGVFPAAGYVEMVFQASRELFNKLKIIIKKIDIKRPMFLPAAEDILNIRFICDVESGNFNIYSQPGYRNQWEHNVTGEIVLGSRYSSLSLDSSLHFLYDTKKYTSKVDFYKNFEKLGFQYGPAFQLAEKCFLLKNKSVLGMITVSETLSELPYIFPPTILDTALQFLLFASQFPDKQYLPTRFEGLHIFGVFKGELCVYAKILDQDENNLSGELFIYDQDKTLIVYIESVFAESVDKEQTISVNKDWFSEIIWQKLNKDFKVDVSVKKIMLFSDSGSVSKDLSYALEKDGYEVISVYPGEYTEISSKKAIITPNNQKSMQKLFSEFADISMIVWLWSLDAIKYEINFSENLDECHTLGIYSLISCLQAVDHLGINTRLWLVTRGMTNANNSKTHISQAHQLGFSRVMSYQEASGQWCGYIDLDPDHPVDEISMLQKDIVSILGNEKEEGIAYRANIRYVARLESLDVSQRVLQTKYEKNKSYLVTGGLGDLGFLVAQYLVKHGAQHIILQIKQDLPDRSKWSEIDLSTDSAQKIQKVKILENTGATIHVISTDITQVDEIKRMSENHVKNGFPEIKGVVHCAGTVRDNVVYNMNRDDIDYVFSTKVNASWALHEAFGKQLDMFVLFSSYASVYGAAGQSNYAAANSFMDLLSIYRQKNNMNCISINFGPWSDIGMAFKLNLDEYFQKMGIHLITPRNGEKVFDKLFNANTSQVLVSPTDWSLVDRLYPSGCPAIFSLIRKQSDQKTLDSVESVSSVNILEQVLNALGNEKNALLVNFLKGVLSDVTRIPKEEISIESRIVDLGVDSLISMDFKNKIEGSLPIKLKLVDLLKGPTLIELSDKLVQEL